MLPRTPQSRATTQIEEERLAWVVSGVQNTPDYKYRTAMNMDPDSKVISKEKTEGMEIKEKGAAEDASTIRFGFQSSTPAALPQDEGQKG